MYVALQHCMLRRLHTGKRAGSSTPPAHTSALALKRTRTALVEVAHVTLSTHARRRRACLVSGSACLREWIWMAWGLNAGTAQLSGRLAYLKCQHKHLWLNAKYAHALQAPARTTPARLLAGARGSGFCGSQHGRRQAWGGPQGLCRTWAWRWCRNGKVPAVEWCLQQCACSSAPVVGAAAAANGNVHINAGMQMPCFISRVFPPRWRLGGALQHERLGHQKGCWGLKALHPVSQQQGSSQAKGIICVTWLWSHGHGPVDEQGKNVWSSQLKPQLAQH